ncbi:BTB/POZ domain-containing protein kctd9 [Balamuthia mandrillaris]
MSEHAPFTPPPPGQMEQEEQISGSAAADSNHGRSLAVVGCSCTTAAATPEKEKEERGSPLNLRRNKATEEEEDRAFVIHGADWVTLNVGGQIFQTSKATLMVDERSMLAKLVSGHLDSCRDPSGAILIDRDPKFFAPILNYLRYGNLIVEDERSVEGILHEAMFFQVQPVIDLCLAKNRPDLTRKEFILHHRQICLNGLRLIGLDLRNLQLEGINFNKAFISNANFKRTNLKNSSFRKAIGHHANFKRAKLLKAVLMRASLPHANFLGVKAQYANLRESHLKHTRWRGADCVGALFQKAILRGADFTDSHLTHAKFQDADLRGADFTGVHLQDVYFSRADLRGAQLDWVSAREARIGGAKVTQKEWDAIPLPVAEKRLFKLHILEEGDVLPPSRRDSFDEDDDSSDSNQIK